MGPCLNNGFTNWDDTEYIVNNPKIRTLSLESVKTIFSSTDLRMYSPLSTFSYALNYRLAGLDPRVFHATDLVLHLANTALVMILTRILIAGVWPAFFTALLFGIHPAHVESVAWAAERKDMLYAFFYLAAMTVYGSGLGRINAYFLSFALFVCALLSKPMAMTLPLALLLMDYLKPEGIRMRHWLHKAPFFAAAAAAAFPLISGPGSANSVHWGGRFLIPFYNLGFYIYTLLWPFDLSAMYIAAPGGNPAIYGLAAGTLAMIFLLWKYFRRDKELVFGAALYTLILLPVLQFFPFGPVISADRYTYLSSIGIFIIAAVCARRIWRKLLPAHRGAAAAFAASSILVLAVTARVRCAVWKDGMSLWSDTARKQPQAAGPLASLCGAYVRARMDEEAENCLSGARRKFPGNDNIHYYSGFLSARKQKFSDAEKYFLSALNINPCHPPALNYMGTLYRLKGDAAKAARYYDRASRCDRALSALSGTFPHDPVQLGMKVPK
jgi:hypothetical protein